MSCLVKLAAQSALPALNQAKQFDCGQKEICVANVEGEYCAMDNLCLHRGGPLGQGTIKNGKVLCPWHGWAWDPKTGQAVHDAKGSLTVYPLRMENGDVWIEV